MATLLFLGGELGSPRQLPEYLARAEYIIAVDGGAEHCLHLGLLPNLLIGDLDSISPATLAHLQAQGVEIERHPRRKDATDLELALDRAAGRKSDQVVLLAALGGRWDMSFGNILTAAAQAYRHLRLVLLASDCTMHILHPGPPYTVHGQVGERISLLALHGEVQGITLAGLEYPLENATLTAGSSRAMSNVLQSSAATISLTQGVLLCLHLHGG